MITLLVVGGSGECGDGLSWVRQKSRKIVFLLSGLKLESFLVVVVVKLQLANGQNNRILHNFCCKNKK